MSAIGGTPTRPGVATLDPPTYIDGRLSALSVDLSGSLRVLISGLAPAPAGGGGSTTLIPVTDAAPAAVIANTACSVITLQEDNSIVNAPTTPFMIMRPNSGATPNQYSIGRSYAFTAPFGTQWQPGQIVGYIQLPTTGSTEFQQDENG